MSIHLIRHGQSEFNAAFTGTGDPMIFDAPLTALGRSQAEATRDIAARLNIEAIIASPMTRAIQTAQLIFPGRKLHIDPQAREHLGHSCDVGRVPDLLKQDFPEVDLAHLADIWWHQGPLNNHGVPVEPWPVFQTRMAGLAQSLHNHDTRPLAVVCHGHVIRELTGVDPANCDIVELIP